MARVAISVRCTGAPDGRYGDHRWPTSVRTPNLHRGPISAAPSRVLVFRCGAQVCQDRKDTAMAVRDLVETELSKDAANVRFDGLVGHDESLRDRRVRPTLGDEPEHLPLALAQRTNGSGSRGR